MYSKNFIRLNVNDNYLSLGNLFRIIKEESDKKNVFWQSELFSIIFNTDNIADSTINNYCTGFRAINLKYKKYLEDIKNKYQKDKKILIDVVCKIIFLIESQNYNIDDISLKKINSNKKFQNICKRLYSISKNDSDINIKFSNFLHTLLNNNNLYEFFSEILFYVVLEKKQPILIEKELNNVIEKSVYDTNISINDIESFINIHLNSGIWSIRGIMQLAKNNNPFACFEVASMEFYGLISGKPRYDLAYKYYKIAEENNHPTATWTLGFLYYRGYIGKKTKHDLYLAFKYFNKARKLNCSNAYNSIGLIFLDGNFPHINQNKNKAIEMFNTAISFGNIYSYNNIGKIYENEKNYKKSFENYIISANSGDSWAANKIGNYYFYGLGTKKNLKKAFDYYTLSSESSILTLCKWSKYNLALKFYKNGFLELGINKDIYKTIDLLESISDDFLPASKELLYIYYNLYIENKKKNNYLEKINYYKLKCELSKDYNENIKKEIECTLKNLSVTPISLPKNKK